MYIKRQNLALVLKNTEQFLKRNSFSNDVSLQFPCFVYARFQFYKNGMNTWYVFIFGFYSSMQLSKKPVLNISDNWYLPKHLSLNCNIFIPVKTTMIVWFLISLLQYQGNSSDFSRVTLAYNSSREVVNQTLWKKS